MNESLDKPIAYGRTAEIYAWKNEHVLKLFYDWFGIEDIKYEFQIAQAVQTSGLPVPSVGEIIRINNRTGLTYQRVNGISMDEMMSRKPWYAVRFSRRMAELHAEMHGSTTQVDIPSLHQKLKRKICHAKALHPDLQSKTLAVLETMPEGNRLCHGDFHPGNIMVTGKNEVIIDWIDTSLGNPLADLARTSIILLGAVESGQIQNRLMNVGARMFYAQYIRQYFSLRPGGEDEYVRWLSIIAAARLSENIPELEKWLVAQVEKGI